MINYILQVILFQVLFLAIYDLLLSKETFFTKNRWYLLGTSMVSFFLPLTKIPSFQKATSQDFLIVLPEIVLSPQKVIEKTLEPTQLETSINYLSILFWIGVAVFLIVFLLKLGTVFRLIIKNEKQKQHDVTLVLLSKTSKAFSFFNYIFLGKLLKPEQREKVIAHELVHTKQKHSLDLLFFEFLKIVMWFNPMVYLYQKRITLVHEYISDNIAANQETKESYVNGLLASIFQVEHIGFVNQFYKQSLIKKRIRMIMKTQSKKINQLKYLLLIPVLGSMLFYVSCSEDFDEEITFTKKLQPSTTYFYKEEGITSSISEKETYLDNYVAFTSEQPLGKEINESDLFPEAQAEYLEFKKRIYNQRGEDFKKFFQTKLYLYNGRPVIGVHMNKNFSTKVDSKYTETEELSFMKIDKVPTYPGCEEGDKTCFSKNIQKHFTENFNKQLPNSLGLSSGRKRVFIQFKIDTNGKITDILARAPHQEIENEVIRVMELLPNVIPGEHQGKKVNVKYSIPFVIFVE